MCLAKKEQLFFIHIKVCFDVVFLTLLPNEGPREL